ncbi:hypothetical protein N7494_009203 [Penicillium frequentans]|uniref:Uncharacterized protein n=1 Tax=Penicillium frequentans TaxID=3151616 RepID=A0AAD6CS13_9EURO|nr:hypothetical protein N7494_009203 [Penicillium glabrum]
MAANKMQAWQWGDERDEDHDREDPALETLALLGQSFGPLTHSKRRDRSEWSRVVVIKAPLSDTDTSLGRSSLPKGTRP